MVRSFTIENPFNPQDGLKKAEHAPGVTILEAGGEQFHGEAWLCLAYLGGKQFYPLQTEWGDTKLEDGDCVYFMPHVGGGLFGFIFIAILAVAAVVVSLRFLDTPSVSDVPEPDPVFDLKGQKNQIRLGHPIEDAYGRVRMWPSYATRAYTQYIGNDEYQYQLFCLGHGSWDLEEPQIEDTPFSNFQDIEFEIVEPGGELTLFPNNVVTSAEVGSIELYGPNEDEHQGYAGPFIACGVNERATRLEVDVSLPQGLYENSGGGSLGFRQATALFEYREIDDNGNPIFSEGGGQTTYIKTIIEGRNRDGFSIKGPQPWGDWREVENSLAQEAHGQPHETTIKGPSLGPGYGYEDHRIIQVFYVYDGSGWQNLGVFDEELNTNTPQRYTLSVDVPQGRYEVRAIRTNDAGEDFTEVDQINWVGLRAFLDASVRDYGDLTLLAVKARATNNLNDTSSNRVNVVGTRKLPNYDSGSGTLAAVDDYDNRTATRSPIWAMVNILRAYHGAYLADSFLDLEHLADEAAAAEAAGIHFDWIYDQRTSIWEAVKLPCFVNRSVPMLNGSRVTTIRDQIATAPSFFVNPENTKEGSFKLELKLFDSNENDGLEVQYIDAASWKPETVYCLLPGESGLNPKRLKVDGVTDRQRAFDLGMYLWAKETYERQQVSVVTGLEGYIPAFGDLARFSSDVPRWGQSGFLISIDGSVLILSEEVTFDDPGETYFVAIRGRHGQDLGPYTVTEGPEANQVVVGVTLPPITWAGNEEPPLFMFGTSETVGKLARITNLQPNGSEEVTITAIVDDQRRFVDYGTAPPLNEPALPPVIPDAPVVTGLTATPVPDNDSFVVVSWNPSLGAQGYHIDASPDGVTFHRVDTTTGTTYNLPTASGVYIICVTAFNVAVGPPSYWADTFRLIFDRGEATNQLLTLF